MKKLKMMLVFLFIGAQVFAQTTITGTVVDLDGSPVPGASVVVQSISGSGTLTSADGSYSIDVPAEGKTLIFSFIGMEAQSVAINGQTVIDVTLASADITLDDVVITALGVSREERSLGYSVQEVSADDIAVKDPTSVANSLQGRVAGVQIKSGAGTVGGSSSVVIRGSSSLGGSNQPLYVVDGVPISNYNFSNDTFRNIGSGIVCSKEPGEPEWIQ